MSIFSTYSQGENRVTSTILAVLSEVHPKITEFILVKEIMEKEDVGLIQYHNQYSKKNSNSILDGAITGSFNYFIETKTGINSVYIDQIQRHLKNYVSKNSNVALIVLTPDAKEPKVLKGLKDIYWTNFDDLTKSINYILEDKEDYFMITEREKYLLLQLKKFFEEENLLSKIDFQKYQDDVIVVANNDRYNELYTKHGVYIPSKANKYYRPSGYMAFYSNYRIRKIVPKILGYINSVNLDDKTFELEELKKVDANISQENLANRLKDILNKEINEWAWGVNKVFLLSKEEDKATTITLKNEIKNDKLDKNGELTPFTQGQSRYVSLEKLQEAKKTSDLE